MIINKVFKLFLRDIVYGISYGKYKYMAFYAIIILLTLSKSLELKAVGSNSVSVFFSLLKDNGYIERLSDYRVPIYWDFIQFFTLFLIGDFLYQDQENNRTYLLLRCQSKINYVFSKVMWIVVQNILIYVMIFAFIFVVASLVLEDFSIARSTDFRQYIESLMAIKVTPAQLLLSLMLGFILTGIVLSTILLLGIQYFNPIVAFLGVVIVSSISTFSDIKWLPAIHSMILKRNYFNLEHHLSFSFSILYSVVLFTVMAVLAIFAFSKKDMLW